MKSATLAHRETFSLVLLQVNSYTLVHNIGLTWGAITYCFPTLALIEVDFASTS
jgi:hypothetical protein